MPDSPIFDALVWAYYNTHFIADSDGGTFPFANGVGAEPTEPKPVRYISEQRLTDPEPILVPVYQRDLDALESILGTFHTDDAGTIHVDFHAARERNRARYGDAASDDRYRP